MRFDLTPLKTRRQLVAALGLSDELLDFILNFQPPADPSPGSPDGTAATASEYPAFFRHRIPKKNKARGYRIAWEPAVLKNEYKKLARWLSKFFEHKINHFPHPATFGYVSGRSIKGNAQAHCGRQFLLAVDIVDFFPSITRAQIEALFLRCGLTAEVAELLSRFVTIGGHLPLGLPTSPVLSNAIFVPADVELQQLAASQSATYTRYSDDMSFSGGGALPSVDSISSVLARYGFSVAASKTRRSRRGQAHFVTGLSVSEPDQPHVPRRKKRRLRQELYYAERFGLSDHLSSRRASDEETFQEGVNRLDGMVKFIAFHEPRHTGFLKPQWSEILRESGARPSYAPKEQHRPPFWICIDEAEFQSPTGPLLALGLSVSQHQDLVDTATDDILEESLSDLFAAGSREAIANRGLHFADATKDLRQSYTKRMPSMPFEGYVVMARLSDPKEYEVTYLRLLGAVIKRRLMAAESEHAVFVVEKNGKVAEPKVRDLIMGALRQLRSENNRHPMGAEVHFVAKPNPKISVPDFLLGVLGTYLRSQAVGKDQPESFERLMFERIRDKYRLILDIDDWVEYSRRKPIQPWNG